jgi:hypothetical protein
VSRSEHATEADPDLLIPIGLALLALREVTATTGDAQLALQYLLFGLDVNDPQVTPMLVEEGVPESFAPALETYVGRRLRPWLRQIDAGDRRATQWAEEALSRLAAAARRIPQARAWAEGTLAAVEGATEPSVRNVWRHALSERTFPGREAIPLLAARGILQEAFGE